MTFYILIPVYQAEAFLTQCLDSVFSQTAQNFRIILVNDGSTDGSAALCDKAAAGIQSFDTVFTDLDNEEGFRAEVLQNKAMGFDGKSLINPKQIRLVHEVFAPTGKEVKQAEAIVRAYREQSAAGVGVFTVNGKMIDIAFIPGAERTLRLAKACGMYEGDLV